MTTTIRTEVNGLEIELQVGKSIGSSELIIKYNGERVCNRMLGSLEAEILYKLFKKKDEPGCNFFDLVQTKVTQSCEACKKQLTH